MRHNRKEVIERITREYEQLDRLVAQLTDAEWQAPLLRPESKDPWTVKDALAHITHWKANAVRSLRRQPKPAEERGLNITDGNRLVYLRWRDRSPQEVLAWHRQVQQEALAALEDAPEAWISGRERGPDWPFDLDGHSADHRLKDIERALKSISMRKYIPSPRPWVAEQVELYESSRGTAGLTLRDTGLPVILVTHRGHKTGAIRKTPLMRVADGKNYILVASQGGAPTHPQWYFNLKADPNVEIRDQTAVHQMRAREVTDPAERERLWQIAVQAFPPYQEYQARTKRLIPVFLAEEAE